MVTSVSNDVAEPWQLRGRALRVAAAMTALLLIVVIAAAWYDLASPLERRPVPLEMAALICKLVIVAGFITIGRRTRSTSISMLAGLVALLAVAGPAVDWSFVDSLVEAIADPFVDGLSLSRKVVHNGILFGALGIAALGLLAAAWVKATPVERPVVGALILLLMAVGVFTGPVNAVAAAGINREWLFAEDFGQAVVLAVMAGYVTGLAERTRRQR